MRQRPPLPPKYPTGYNAKIVPYSKNARQPRRRNNGSESILVPIPLPETPTSLSKTQAEAKTRLTPLGMVLGVR